MGNNFGTREKTQTLNFEWWQTRILKLMTNANMHQRSYNLLYTWKLGILMLHNTVTLVYYLELLTLHKWIINKYKNKYFLEFLSKTRYGRLDVSSGECGKNCLLSALCAGSYPHPWFWFHYFQQGQTLSLRQQKRAWIFSTTVFIHLFHSLVVWSNSQIFGSI